MQINIGNDKLVDAVKKMLASCITCFRFKKPSLKPVVSLPMASKFNESVSIDLKSWDKIYFLVMIGFNCE